MQTERIRRAEIRDMDGINHLLRQVLMVHYRGRPDLFEPNTKKYTDEELAEIIRDDKRPIFVLTETKNAEDEKRMSSAGMPEKVLGYVFCIRQEFENENNRTSNASLYIDDLCVDETLRGRGIGRKLYDYVVAFARKEGFYNVTLNVWTCNPEAKKFYESCGLKIQKYGMEKIL